MVLFLGFIVVVLFLRGRGAQQTLCLVIPEQEEQEATQFYMLSSASLSSGKSVSNCHVKDLHLTLLHSLWN